MFENNTLLCRLILRRDRFRMLIWLAVLLALVIGYAAAISGMYQTAAERLMMAETMKNPAMVAMVGPIYDIGGEYTTGLLYANEMVLWMAMLMGIMNLFFVVRHTRKDEERGRIEVIRSLPVGRLSGLSAVMTISVFVNAVFALFMGLGLSMLRVESMDFAGSMLFGAAMGATGLLVAAVTSLFCQLSANPRTAQTMSFGFLIAAYMIRAMGDMQSELLACLSPLGLILRTKIYADNDWRPVAAVLLISAATAVIAFRLCAVRDMGAGLIPARPGRRDAAPDLKSAEGLAWKLLRTPLILWTLVVTVIGMAYGSIMGDLESFISSNELFKTMFPDGNPAQFVSFLMVIMSLLGTIPVLQFIFKARLQERGGYAENVLARAVSRYSQLFGYFRIAALAGILMPFLNAVGFWAGSVTVMETPIPFPTLLGAAMVYVPAVWFMLGLAMMLIAYLPRLTFLAWAYLGYAFFLFYMGSAIQLPEWVKNISPFTHIPKIPMEEFSVTGVAVLTAAAAVMCVMGFVGYRRRDMITA